ncbi:MAG TPA: chemotaxis protein CheW [Pyrinomonadaceae bacterium]|nr:chemotaxis protein CheW [Pyrinomonadaceae bacterium]
MRYQPDILMPVIANAREVSPDPQLHDLVPFLAGNKTFAVFAEHVEGTAEAKMPAALPRAPAAVLGVVCARGRMLTVLDPVALVGGEANGWPKSLPCVIALRGDEQLAFAAEESRDVITIAAVDIQRSTKSEDDVLATVILGIARYGGEEITVLNVDQLFATAVRRKERRRRRF